MTVDVVERIGRVGVWTQLLSRAEPQFQEENAEAAAELDELGFGTLWLGGSPAVERAAPLLAATRRITVATGILSVWSKDAASVAQDVAALGSSGAERFLLGLGVSHGPMTPGYGRPMEKMAEFLDGLDGAGQPVPSEQRVLAALGPKMLELSARRSAGAHPYLVTVEHVARSREVLGKGKVLAPELGVVLDADRARARETARGALSPYLGLPNYTRNWLRLGFTEEDLANGGSDTLLDALFVLGDTADVRTRVAAFHEAGADHVALQVIRRDGTLPREEWRQLAQALPIR
ncbi:LLM class F420-dependent oxidoreductase [Actinacidiphila yeochonensis]|uniref:LLM class F420-dependent oxidoreductase n=1 Tax=Actinacidiphila yeochonensis TaxID=89050 RepID=UPI00055B17C6|nr:LLM class F420-dependent oxidoreductase [Actinacidiphila yeochonensis]